MAPENDPATTPAPNGAPNSTPAPAAPNATFTIPETYKSAGYLQNAKSYDDVFKMLDNSQKLLGERPAGVPQDNATEEVWNKFYSAVGRPEKADAYEFDNSTLAEGQKRDTEMEAKVKGIFHQAGLSPRQAKAIQSGYEKMMSEYEKAASTKRDQEQAEYNAKFDTDSASYFGARKDQVLTNAKALLEKHTPDSMKAHVAKLGNTELLTLAAVLDGVHQAYIKEDAPNKGGSGGQGASIPELEAQAHQIMATEDWKSNLKPGHQAAREKVTALFQQISKLKASAQ